MTRQQLFDFIKEEFRIEPDFPFDKDFETAIFRRKDNKKWFGILMKVGADKLGLDTREIVEVLNVKIDPNFKIAVLQQDGMFEAYHMNKTHWISILISRANEEDIKFLLRQSFNLVKKNKTK